MNMAFERSVRICAVLMVLLSKAMVGAVSPGPPPPVVPLSPLPKTYVIAFQWPPTLCKFTGCIPKKTIPASFKLHGLWPSLINWPKDKCTGPAFEYPKLTDMEQALESSWPSYLGKESIFWEKEWDKHGTCSGLKEEDYFETALSFATTNASVILSALQSQKMSSEGATPDEIKTALASVFGVNCQLTCKQEEEDYYLQEVRFCLDDKLAFKNCPKQDWIIACGPFKDDKTTKINLPTSSII